MPVPSDRGPLPYIILAQTGEDVRNCVSCELCEGSFPGKNLSINELMQAAARDDTTILKKDALWTCEEQIESTTTCLGGIDIPKVLKALQQEAILRGFQPRITP